MLGTLACGLVLGGFAVLAVAQGPASGQIATPAPSPVNPEACKQAETGIKERAAAIVEQAQPDRQVIDQVATQVTRYYTDQAEPAGAKVRDYEAATKEIEKRQAAIDGLVEDAKSARDAFSCEGNNPRQDLDELTRSLTALSKGMKDYRGTVRTLTVSVRTADVAARRPTPSPISTEKPRGVL